MNTNFIELTRDNLSSFISAPKLLVIYGSRGCGACKQMKPKLKNVSDLLPMVYVEAPMFSRATQLYPGVIKNSNSITLYIFVFNNFFDIKPYSFKIYGCFEIPIFK